MTEKSKSETLRRKKRRREKLGEEINNLVAKHMNTYNKPRRHADLSKDHDSKRDKYKRWKFGEDDDS